MGNFDGRGDSLNLKSDKGGEPSSLISRVKHLLRHNLFPGNRLTERMYEDVIQRTYDQFIGCEPRL